jgi:type I restriction-modification system DNA methylase subunit
LRALDKNCRNVILVGIAVSKTMGHRDVKTAMHDHHPKVLARFLKALNDKEDYVSDFRILYLLNLPEGTDIGKAINEAMKAIEADNEDLKDVLPKTYNSLEKNLLVSLLKNFAAVPMTIEGDAFGKLYEYFLGKFAMAEGQKGGESRSITRTASPSFNLRTTT